MSHINVLRHCDMCCESWLRLDNTCCVLASHDSDFVCVCARLCVWLRHCDMCWDTWLITNVWHDSLYMCDMTQHVSWCDMTRHVCVTWLVMYVWHDSAHIIVHIRVLWRMGHATHMNGMRDMTRSYVWQDPLVRCVHRCGRCAMTHSYTCQDSFMCVT